ncbi:VCBS domain-containing protein [Vibrio campbellii]
MAKNNNVETHKKNTKIENEKSSELKPKERTKKKKLRLHSHLRVNIPLFQSLMMILPSLAKHAEATEGAGDSTHDMDLAATTPVADETIVDKHAGAAPSEATHPNTQTNESQQSPNVNESQAPHGANTHLVPSHHLSTLSHPQVHYIPSVSMPTISAGGNGQPTHSNTPPTPTTPVTFIPEVLKGTYGELHVDINGQYTFVLNPNSPQYILLNQHQQGTDHFALHLSNGASIVVQVPVTGKQDLPSISGDLTGVVTEDHNIDSQGLLHANGKIDVIDPDQDESSVTPEVISGKYGLLTIDADGHWQYQVDNSLSNVQALTGATSLHESFTIHTKDGTPQTIDMTIGGNDDNAVITGVDAGSVIEDLTTQVQGQLSVTDPDLGEDHFQASQVNGHFGTLTITKDGAWTYDLDNYSPYVQRLAQGSTATDIITVHSADGTAHQVTITINGTNDSAVITNNTGGSPNSFFVVGKSPHLDQVIEDYKLTVSGKLSISDIDAKEAHFSNIDVAGTLGTLHLKDNGAWTYDLDNTNPAVQALGKSSATTDIMTIHSADGTPHQITIIINGTNDRAVIGGTSSGAVTEETQLQTSGTLTITDVDTGEAHFSNTDVSGALGTLHLKDNGAWTYDLDNTNPTVQALGKGATATDTITVHSADGTPHQITVTINGTNDRPTISGTSSGAVIEQGLSTAGTPDATGSLIATDIDKSDTITWAINQPQGQWGTLSIDQNGHWHYQLDNSAGGAADKLASGEHQSEQFWITATDSAGATVPHKIVIDVQGSNDKPIVSAWTQLTAGKEDQPVTIKASDLLTHASDVDSSDILHVTNLQATHGSLTDNKDGTYTFTPDKDFNGEIRLTYDVVDGHGGSVSTQAKFDLTATPDNAIITDAQTNADLRGVTEDRGYIDTHYQLHYDGKLNIQDPDAGEAQFDPNIGPQTYQGIGYDTKLGGHILLMRDGHYTYTLDNRNIQNLAQGEVKHDSAVIRSADGTTHTIELTVHGTNDAPTINAQSHSVTEGGSVLNGQMVGQDIDTGATLTYSAPQIDGLMVNPDGSYSFNPAHSSYQSLASGVTKTLTVPVTVTDEHNASSTQNLSITITGVNNSAVIGGVDTGDVTEGNAGQDMSPDFAQPGMAHLVRSTIKASGKLTISDSDTGEAEFDTHGLGFNYSGQYGDLLLRKDGTWFYHADTGQIRSTGGLASTRGTAIDQLGENQTLTDTITVYSKDGTSHDIVITIHGSNDRPYCASEVQLNSGKEDLAQTITATELLANTVDVDANDAGKLTIANLHTDHGSIQDNHDGTFTFTPSHNYNGSVHFTYDVKDAHGGTTHTGANTSLAATPDKAIISEVTTGRVIEDGPHATHNNGTTTELANGQLQVIDPDSGEDKFQYSQFGETRIHDPFGGMLRIDSAGNWGYSVDNAALQHLAQGQVETVTYRVHSFDGTAYDLNIDVVGTNDAPTVTKVVLSNGTEDINYQMQASQFGFTDVDTGDTLHSIAITDLPPAAQGKFLLDGHDITAGQSIAASDIAKLQFVPTPNFNGDVQFKFTVNDGHVDSQEATNTLHVDAVSDAAQFTGRDTGDVHEGHTYTAPDGSMSGGYVDDRSPDHMHGNIGKIWNDEIHTDGHLNIFDPDSGESHAQTGTYQGTHGHVILQSNGDWSYYASIGQDATGRRIDRLGQGESITDTVTVKSADGTTHDIHITIHGDNDSPYCSSEVQLNSGKEDLAQTITTTELLANTVDVDTNDAGQLSVANLHADHGTLVDNKDGTFTFTPDHNFNGKVHFTYDVKDAHGGVTHTGASTTLLPSNDAATLQPTLASNFVTEDHLKSGTSTNELWSGWKNLDIQDIDSPSEAKVTQIEVNGVKHTVPANFAMNLAGAHGTFNFTHSTDGHDKWSYSADNSHTEVQSLSHGDSLTDTITLITADGTRIPLAAKILGTDDHVIIDTPDALTAALGTAIEDKVTSISGALLAHDSDSKDSVTFTAGNSVGSYGTLHVDSNGQWHYDLDHSKANALQQGETKAEGFDITAISTDGSTATKHIEVLVQGSSDAATISVTSNPDVHEDGSSTAVEIISGKLSAVDPDHDQSAFSTDVGKRHDPFNSGVHGGLNISKDGSWTYTVNNSQIQQLAAGQEEHVQYNVHTVGGDYHVIDIKIVGTNDIPTVSATTLAHGTEDTHYQMQASQFGFTDIDTGDTLHSIAITDLPPAAQGKFVLDGHDITAGQSIATADIAKLQFVPATDFNGDVQFKFTVNDGHASSAEATNTLHIDAVGDAATIAGVDTGDVTEDSFYGMQWLLTQGKLTISDPDSGEAQFDPVIHAHNYAGIGYDTKLGGHILLSRDGSWDYQMDNFSPEVQKLAAGETAVDTVTVHSVDGTLHDIQITIHGTNDAPVLSVAQTTPTTGTLTETDVDVKDTHTFSVVNSTGQFGSLSVDPDSGAYVYTANGSVAGMSYNAATHTYHGTDVFEVKVADNHGGESSKFITFDANGHVSVVPGQSPTIATSVPSNPLVTTTQPSLPAGTNTPPNNAVTVDLATSSDTGTSDTDNLTKDSTPTITGHTDIPYSQVTIYDGSTPIGHAVSDGSGQYSVAVSSLSNGDHNLSAKALAPSSVLPATSSILPLHVDTVIAPLQVSLTHDTGSNLSDLITSDGSLTITGQEAGATVEYSTDNGHTWTSSFTPQSGSNTVSVRQTDTAGNVSTPTSLTFTYDDQIAAPSIDLKASTDSGVSTTDDLTNIHTPIITGTAEANSAISITDETGKVIATGTANSSGVYQLTTSDIAEGKHTLTVSSTDVAGNQSSASLPVEVDYTAPTISNVNLKTETTHQPTFSGTVSPDTTSVDIVIKSGSTIIETLHATLDGKGGYSVDATNLPDHSYTAYIQATDKAGNSTASGYAGTFDRFSVDTHASAPTISFESTGADNLYNAAEVASGTASTITSTIHLPSDAHPKDTLTINGQSHQITDAEFLAKSVNIEVAPGASITASITDKNGNTSTVTNATAPSADITVAPLHISLTHDTGSNSSDLITSDGSLTITGQEAGATVEYSTDNGNTWTSSFTPQQGSNTVSVRQTDAAGNVSPDTSVTFTLDNTIAAPAVSLRNDTGRHSVNTPDLITKDSQLTIQTEAGAKVEYSNDGGHTWTAVFNPVEGVNDLQVRQTDIAGNVSPVTHFSFTLDTTPGTITVNPISHDNALNAAENNQPLVITGTTSNIAPGDVVYVVIGNKHFYDATVKPDGTWSLTLGTSIHQNIMATDRDYSIQVGTVDTAGNSTPRISTHLLVDTQSPIPHIAVDSVTQDNVLNALESGQTIAITGTVTGDYQTGDIVSLKINGATISSLTGSVDSSGHFSIPVAGNILEHANIHTSYANGQSGSIHSIEATIITTDAVGNVGSATTGSQVFSVDTHVSLPTITFENPGPDGLYSKAEIAHGDPNTVTATILPPGDAKVGEHLVVNGQDHVLDAHTLQHGLQIEVNPGSQVQVTMTDEHGNTAGSQGVAASAIPEPIVVKPPSGSHQVSGTLGVPPLVPSQTPVPSAQNGWRIHLPNGQYVTSHHGQYGTLTIDPQTGHLHYQEQAQVHTGPHGSASGIGQHEDKFEIALQGTNQDEVVAHVNVQILSHGPGHSGKLTIGTEVVDMTITPIVHASHPAPPPPPPVQHDEPEIASHEDFTFTVSEDTSLDLSQHAHQEPDQKTDHHGAAAYLDALGIQPNASPSTGHDQPADMDIVLAQVDQQHAVDCDQTHLDMSDALEHHNSANNQDDEHHHHNDIDGLPDIDPNN